jgi:hypothetical protein
MVRTDEAKREAAEQEDLTLLAESGPWQIYRVADSDVVEPLDVQPVVVADRSGDQRERHLEVGTSWLQHRDEWAAIPADDGPETWQRIEVEPDLARREENRVDIVVPTEEIDPVTLPAVEVSDVEIGQQEVSFRVDQVGVPVLVKVSYFPNWAVEGAEGPYRVAPNMMVVVPTENEVRLEFERSSSDLFFYALTLLGIGMLIFLRIRGDADLDPEPAVAGTPPTPPPPPTGDGETWMSGPADPVGDESRPLA